jgi:predicted sugar kinase
MIDEVRRWGFPGVGQSSWGPTVFVAASSQSQAEELVRRLAAAGSVYAANCLITRPASRGARMIVND